MNFYHCFGNVVPHARDLPAVFHGDEVHANYGALDARARRLGAAFASDPNLSPGDRIAIVMTNAPEYFEILFAIWVAGLCAVPINAKLHEKEFAYILKDSGAKICFVTPDRRETLARAVSIAGHACRLVCIADEDYGDFPAPSPVEPATAAPEDIAWLFYTSGTTGMPKGAMLTHRNLWLMTLSFIADAGPFDHRTRALMLAPLSHASGLLSIAYLAKSAGLVVPESGGFDPEEVIDLVNHHGHAEFFAAPTMVKRLVEFEGIGKLDAERLTKIVYGGGPMYIEDTKRALSILGPRLWQIYGQGETPCTISFLSCEAHADSDHPRHEERLASVGVMRTGITMRIVNEAGQPVPVGTVGEIAVRGDTVMAGYWKNEEATAKAIRDGWLHTGDLGVLDEDGFLTLKDRSKDLIISGGTNIYPREIEEVLLTHPAVREAAVVGRRHPEWGEEPVAFISLFAGASVEVDELEALCLQNIARFKRPKQYIFSDELPKNNYGKIVKTELRKRLYNTL